MAVTAQLVKKLRERTGAGILDSKKALESSNGDIEKAIEFLKEKGQAKAAKKAGRISAEGLVSTIENSNSAVIVEINSETDFVSKNAQFQKLVKDITEALLSSDFNNDEEASKIKVDGKTIEELCINATATIGEKISFRRASKFIAKDNEVIGSYTHANGQIASLVLLKGSNKEAAKNVAMHIAAMNPDFLNAESMPKEKIEEFKKEILKEMVGIDKPDNIKEKMAEGKLRKVLSELTLIDQEFVMEKMSVGKYLQGKSLEAKEMIRFEVGEGIEKQETDFAAEVASQMKK
ncbi:MAG: elongation factor Ts [Mycoplasma sp.]|nr:elongation factor Ts [Mycoplasma sp.]